MDELAVLVAESTIKDVVEQPIAVEEVVEQPIAVEEIFQQPITSEAIVQEPIVVREVVRIRVKKEKKSTRGVFYLSLDPFALLTFC